MSQLRPESPRARLLEHATYLVCGDRNISYGEPTADFERIASMLQVLGYTGPEGREILSHDVAVIQVCLKLSRLSWKYRHEDSWTDIAGYAACGYECTVNPGSESSSE
jgi:Domain of unknown function (DUF6378)